MPNKNTEICQFASLLVFINLWVQLASLLSGILNGHCWFLNTWAKALSEISEEIATKMSLATVLQFVTVPSYKKITNST